MRLVHPNSVSGDLMMMTMGFLDQAGEKKNTIVSVPNQLQGRAGGQSSGVRSSPWLSLSSCGDVGNTSELIHKLSPLQTRLARGLQ